MSPNNDQPSSSAYTRAHLPGTHFHPLATFTQRPATHLWPTFLFTHVPFIQTYLPTLRLYVQCPSIHTDLGPHTFLTTTTLGLTGLVTTTTCAWV